MTAMCKVRWITLFLMLEALPLWAAPPHVLFIDLDSGPKTGGEHNQGVYVTIFGKRFGAAPQVTIGGGEVARIVAHCEACSNAQLGPAPSDRMDVVVVELGARVATGDVVVTTPDGQSSGGPTFTVRPGRVFCVSPAGKDAASHGTFAAGCWQSVIFARNAIAPGDTVYVRAGVLTTGRDPTQAEAWCAALVIGKDAGDAGTAGNPKALVAYPGETVTIGDTSGSFDPNGRLLRPRQTCAQVTAPLSQSGKAGSIKRTSGLTRVRIAGTDFHASLRGARVGAWVSVTGTRNYNRVLRIRSLTLDCMGSGRDADHCWKDDLTLLDPGDDLPEETTATLGVVSVYDTGIRSKGGSDYWTIAGFQVRGVTDAINWKGAHTRLINLDLSAPGGDNEAACQDGAGDIDDLKWYGVKVHDCGIARSSTAKFFHQVYWCCGNNHGIDQGWFEIGGNNWGCSGIQDNASASHATADYDWQIHDGYLHDNRCAAIALQTVDPAKGAVRLWNLIIQRSGIGPSPIDGGGSYSCIRANQVAPGQGTTSGNIEIYNSTFQDCGALDIHQRGTRGIITNDGRVAAIGITASNLLVLQPVGQPYLESAGPITVTHSHCFGNGECPGDWQNSSSGDPNLADRSGKVDFHLTSASPLSVQDSGQATSAKVDLDGVNRPQRSAHSRGAYELPARKKE